MRLRGEDDDFNYARIFSVLFFDVLVILFFLIFTIRILFKNVSSGTQIN